MQLRNTPGLRQEIKEQSQGFRVYYTYSVLTATDMTVCKQRNGRHFRFDFPTITEVNPKKAEDNNSSARVIFY